ncbi:rod shape-determining protein RodA [Escherichia coli]|uniref:Rod shape-determining protein RodA n=1 Tax=Escherichia coli TaxID=562 RepID=A0A376KZL2_ECOLX|nr:rod shape-determining protein RodA [Escherichia coli]
MGILILLALYILLIMRGLWIAARAQTTFGRVMAGGLMLILFVYVFVNIGMVSGYSAGCRGSAPTGQLWRISANCAGWLGSGL